MRQRSIYDRFGGDDGSADTDAWPTCDGCNVLPPHEHRCHGADEILVEGRRMPGPCACPACHEPETGAYATTDEEWDAILGAYTEDFPARPDGEG